MDKEYCYYCDKEVDYEVKEENVPMDIKGTKFTYQAKIARCKECGEEISIHELNNENTKNGHQAYLKAKGE
jgi:uncharacterized protein with PIN domain